MILVYKEPFTNTLISSGCDGRTKIVPLITKKLGRDLKGMDEYVDYVFIDRDGNTTHGRVEFKDV